MMDESQLWYHHLAGNRVLCNGVGLKLCLVLMYSVLQIICYTQFISAHHENEQVNTESEL